MSKKGKKQYKDVIGLIKPEGIRHHDSKLLCNNPDIVITRIHSIREWSGWYTGDFIPLKTVGTFETGRAYCIYGFRPRRVLVK